MLHTSHDLTTAAFYNVAFWSLPPEVEFYLVLPLLAILVAAWARHSRRALLGLIACALLMKLGLVALAWPGEAADSLRSILTVHLPGLLVEFLLGSAAAAAAGHVRTQAWGEPWAPAQRRTALCFGAALLGLAVWAYQQHLATPTMAAQTSSWLSGTFGLWVALGFAMMLPALVASRSVQAVEGRELKARGTTLALWLGRLSYGLYLFHNAAPELLRRTALPLEGWSLALASLALTVLLAGLLHLTVEAPCRAYGRSLAAAWQRAITTRMSGESR
jgi:peptidoglycan/LPS O-acetylase OafA/YrhL